MTHFEKLSFVVQVTFNTGRELISSCAYAIREFISSSSYSHQRNNLSQLALTKNSLPQCYQKIYSSQYLIQTFHTVLILLKKKVEENFPINGFRLRKQMILISAAISIIFIKSVLIIYLRVSLSWRGGNNFTWDFLGFLESSWTKFCQKFRIEG